MLVSLEQVHKEFHGGKVRALQGVSLEIGNADSLAVTGPSGSGKSTLLHLLGAMDEPTAGRVVFGSGSSRTVRERAALRARVIGFVFQSFNLLPGLTAAENVQVPMFGVVRSASERAGRAASLLEAVGLAGRARHFPPELSGGEQQRVAIARAIANRPQLLLADEPTGNLDSRNSELILDLLLALRETQGAALVVVTHNAGIAARFGRSVAMLDGKLSDSPRG